MREDALALKKAKSAIIQEVIFLNINKKKRVAKWLNRQILSQAVPNQNRIKISLKVKNPMILLIFIKK